MLKAITIITAFSAYVLIAQSAAANELDQRRLKEISEHAHNICGNIALEGQTRALKTGGSGSAEVKGLAKWLLDIGFSGEANYDVETYTGYLQNHLAKLSLENMKCKENISISITSLVQNSNKRSNSANTQSTNIQNNNGSYIHNNNAPFSIIQRFDDKDSKKKE